MTNHSSNIELQILLGKVSYKKIDRPNRWQVDLRKNRFYSYENEVRAVIFDQYEREEGEKKFDCKPKHPQGLGVKVDLNKLIESVYVAPMSPEWFYNLVKHVITEKYHFNFPVCRSEIQEEL